MSHPDEAEGISVREVSAVFLYSFVVSASIGTPCFASLWISVGLPKFDVVRAAMFVALLAGVHMFGFILWRKRFVKRAMLKETESAYAPLPAGPKLRKAIASAVIQQAILLGLTVSLLDGGFTFRVILIAALGHWGGIALILVRRAARPTKLDIGVINFGLLIFWVLTACLTVPVLAILALW